MLKKMMLLKHFNITGKLKFFLFLLLLISLSASFIATEKPWYVKYKNNYLFPAFSFKKQIALHDEIISYQETDWKLLKAEKIIFAPVPWSPGKSDFDNAGYVSPTSQQFFRNNENKLIEMPLRFRHWLGTDKRGADVLSGVLNGASVSLFIGIVCMLIATIIGLLFGVLSGYYGNYSIRVRKGVILSLIPGIFIAFFYAKMIADFNSILSFFSFLAVFIIVLCLFYFFGLRFSQLRFLASKMVIPVDSIISRLIEWVVSLPRLILVLTIAAISQPSIINLVLLIGLTGWTEIARLTRAEFIKNKQLDYVQAARSLGYSDYRIAIKHILPNAITPSLVAILFGISSAILAEAGLSFLGIGVPQDKVTWGSMLAAGKENFQAWWLVIFPGLALFLTVLLFNATAERIRNN